MNTVQLRRTCRLNCRHYHRAGAVRKEPDRIPREFESAGEDALMRKDGLPRTIEPVGPQSLVAELKKLSPIDDDVEPVNRRANHFSELQGSQPTVRIPREFESPGKDALMRKDRLRLIIDLAMSSVEEFGDRRFRVLSIDGP